MNQILLAIFIVAGIGLIAGLGLAIARSFTELQKGTFAVDVDGDLFKVTLVWKKDL